MTTWEIIETTEYSDWFDGLTERQQRAINARKRVLSRLGPTAGRPYVDTLRYVRTPKLKELRIRSEGELRVIFAFDRKRRAILLIGGNKSENNMWNRWYPTAIQRAEELLREHERRGD